MNISDGNRVSLSRTITLVTMALLAVVGLCGLAMATDANSNNYRLVGAGNASVTATSGSPTYQLYLVGGSGVPVGIAASTNFSVVSGGTSNILPTDRIFGNGMEN